MGALVESASYTTIIAVFLQAENLGAAEEGAIMPASMSSPKAGRRKSVEGAARERAVRMRASA